MILLTVRERDRLPVGTGFGFDPRMLNLLVRLLPQLPAGSVTLEHQAVRFGPFCGVLRLGETVIEVLPKVAMDDGIARGTVAAMLRTVGDLRLAPAGAAALGAGSVHLLDLFILDFCASVQERLRQGGLRSYQTREEALTIVRGRLQFVETMRRPFDQSRPVCRYDDLSPDNAHNRALKFVLRRLLKHCLGGKAKTAVNSLLLRMQDVGDQACSASDVERLGFDRLTRPWEPVFLRAASLLRGLFPDLFAGRQEAVGLLFSMERLFERFVGVVLRRTWSGSEAEVMLQGPSRSFVQTTQGGAFGMRPDVAAVTSDGRTLLIVDAKWKQLDRRSANVGVGRDDIYQMAAYAARYRCRELALLYPCQPAETAGLVEQFKLPDPLEAQVSAYALDVAALTRGQELPKALCPDPACMSLPKRDHVSAR